jgi:hypothetical protein
MLQVVVVGIINRNKMKTNFKVLIILFIAFISCTKQKQSDDFSKERTVNTKTETTEALEIFQQNCYACHSVTTKSHDEIIAPPMIAIKKRYSMTFKNKADFVNAIVAYSSNPKSENALMIGAVNKFNVMPKQPFNKEDLKKIATYIYENEIEEPTWFGEHFKENHKNGQGMGNGMRKNNN